MPAHRITTLPRSLLNYTDQPVPNSRKLYYDAISAKFPAHQVNGIWHYEAADLPMIAAAYGLAPRVQGPQRRETVTASATAA